jgi:hypothetical protein
MKTLSYNLSDVANSSASECFFERRLGCTAARRLGSCTLRNPGAGVKG